MLIGRAAETAAIDGLLADAHAGKSGVLVVRGEPGIGKSALLEHARAQADGMTVLRAVGIESEAELAYAALHQVLRPVFERIDRLPAPQAAALRGAFALSDETVGERFRVSLAVLGLLAELAEERPLLCLVDDAQWLDQASADALVFVARRVLAEPLALLFAARDDPERPFAAPGLPELRPPALEAADARALVGGALGTQAPQEVVDWVLDHANGNPLALLELPSVLSATQLAGREPLVGRLPPPTSVEQAYLDRAAALPADARELLLLAAAEQTGDRSTISRAAAELGLDVSALRVAEEHDLVRVGSDRIEFRHPLVRSALYRGAGFAARERCHRILAAVLSAPADADRRAWHRAAATAGTDEEVAAELERTADRARLRGGHSGAAAALERAADLSTDAESRGRRLVAAAGAAWQSGHPDRALALLERADPIVTDPRAKGELAHVRGDIGLRRGSLLDACETLFAGAADVAPHDPQKAFAMLIDAAAVAGRTGDVARMVEAGSRIAALPTSADPNEARLSDLVVAVCGILGGRSASAAEIVHESIRLALDSDDPRLLSWAVIGASLLDDQPTEAALLTRATTVARGSGAVDTVVLVLEAVVAADIGGGRYTAEIEASEGLRLAREVGLPNAVTAHLAALVWTAALRGSEDECRAYAAEVARAVRTSAQANASSWAEWGVAMLDLSLGRAEATVHRLTLLRTAPIGIAHPYFVLMSSPDLIEASLRTGQAEQAQEALAGLDAFAHSGGPAWSRAYAARCRALLSSGDKADEAFREALELHAETNRLFDRARTELLYGEFLRRARQRSEAREHLRSAVDIFDRVGAEVWAERARVELRATGERARKRDPSTIDELTPQELQIARLVGEGSSNKEVAAQLFLSPRTVEYHLRKVFAKLGITSRSELIRHGVGEREPAVV